MAKLLKPGLIAQLLIVLVLTSLLALSSRPHEADRRLVQARRSMQYDAPLAVSEHLARVLEYLPSRVDLWELAGRYAILAGDVRGSIRYLEQASAHARLTAEGQIALGDAYRAKGDIPRAIQAWQKVPPSVDVYNRLAKAHRAINDYEACVEDLKAWLALQPGDAQLNYRLGLLLAATEPQAASAYLEQAASLDPSLSPAAKTIQDGLGRALFEQNQAYTYLLMGRALAALGHWDLAVEAFHRATLAEPGYAEAWAFLGEAIQHLPSPEEAGSAGQAANPQTGGQQTTGQQTAGLPELQKALSLDPNSVAANVFMALYWQRQERYTQALGYLQVASRLEPDNPALLAEIGNTYSDLGDLPTALEYYQKAVELTPKDPLYFRILAEFSLEHQIQVREIALPALRQALILAPEDPVTLDLMGHALSLLEDYANAERYLLRAIRAQPDYAPAHLHLGMNYLLQGDIANARRQLALASSLAPDTPVAERAERLLQRYFP